MSTYNRYIWVLSMWVSSLYTILYRDAAESFIQKLKEVQFGPLAQVNLDQMRQKANQNIRKLKMKEDNKPMWYSIHTYMYRSMSLPK